MNRPQIGPNLSAFAPSLSAPTWNDVASSICVRPGYRVTLYIHNEAQGRLNSDGGEPSIVIEGNVPDFRALSFSNGAPVDDNVSRVVIENVA